MLIGLALAATAAAMPTAFIGRYEADKADCRYRLATRDDDEATGDQGGALFLISKRSLHFVQFDFPVRSVQRIGSGKIRVVYINDVDADGRKLVPQSAILSFTASGDLLMVQAKSVQRYFRCAR